MAELIRIPNPMKGLVTLVKEGIVAESAPWIDPPLGNHVYSGGIPKKVIDGHKAINCVNMDLVPSSGDMGEVPIGWIRVDIKSYGINFSAAGDVDLAVYSLLKPLRGITVPLNDGTDGHIYFRSAIPRGSMQWYDPDTDWPCHLRTYRIHVGERIQTV